MSDTTPHRAEDPIAAQNEANTNSTYLDPWANASGPSLPLVDSDNSDNDSAVGGVGASSSTASLRPSLYDNVEEHGRTYHKYKQGKYMLPNDEPEQERLDLQHHLFGLTFEGRLHLAPISPNIQNALDLATGTGIWAIDFAQKYPSASVLGTDLSAIQPLYIPPNCRFEIDDMEDIWTFSERFDLIHGRALATAMTNPTSILTQAFNSLIPGGYLELQDAVFPHLYIGDPPTDTSFYRWNTLLMEGVGNLGKRWNYCIDAKRIMEEVGFVDVVEKRFYWPTSPWPKGDYLKEISMYFQEDLLRGLEGLSLKVFTKGLGWSAEQVEEFLPEVREDIKRLSLHSYLPIYVVYGRKPVVPANDS